MKRGCRRGEKKAHWRGDTEKPGKKQRKPGEKGVKYLGRTAHDAWEHRGGKAGGKKITKNSVVT